MTVLRSEDGEERAASPLVGLAGDPERWYKDAVIYEVHVRAFQDSNGDGIGDFRGLTSRLDYLQDLGVTAVWLLPFYPSPLRDDGYDISDYRRVNPSYGSLRDFRLFLREAHRRGLRVITELVVAHTSDQHPWFQRARRAPAGSAARDFYLWSDTPDRFADARIIFKDFETSNWTWDPVAGAYYWHRFYSHQPALNYDNPLVRQAVLDIVDYWLAMGVDGLRLDAIPYLYAREGTTCENLPETFAFLRELRRHIDERFEGRMLLAEANQWPEDAAAYMADGVTCHMAFHFPLMPRMFMAVVQEDRFPIVDILAETPPIHESCQWALFLRNHDELTLEMVTDEERDYMYRAYARDPQARVNVGIRRRLAPLLGNDRRLIEVMHALLCSLPGTPILYYGDEIGMGDNIYLGDRNAVRTPMQWSADRNAGFSTANPQQLYLPVVMDPEYQPQAVNVEAQRANPASLWWWMKRLLAVRNRHRAFARGSFVNLRPENRKVLAFLRIHEDEHLLVVANLSRHAQAVRLDLSAYRNAVPVELFGGTEFPPVGDLPYLVTLAPYGFYWFALSPQPTPAPRALPSFRTEQRWTEVLTGRQLTRLQQALGPYLSAQRWFRDKARGVRSVSVADAVPLWGLAPAAAGDPDRDDAGQPGPVLAILHVELREGEPETYLLPLAWWPGSRGEELHRYHPEAVVAELAVGERHGYLVDAARDERASRALVAQVGRRRQVPGRHGALAGVPAPPARRLLGGALEAPARLVGGDQSNTSVVLGDQVVAKLVRQPQPGTHPGVEVGRFLAERARFPHSPAVVGSLEYRPAAGEPMTVLTVEEYRANEGDGFSYVVDALRHGLEQAVAHPEELEHLRLAEGHVGQLAVSDHAVPDHWLIGPHLEWATLLGQRTAELHRALASDPEHPAFAPEPLTATDRQAMYQASRALLRRTLRQLRALPDRHPLVDEVLGAEHRILAALRPLAINRVEAPRIRCHGDYHLGQVLWTGKDFVIIDFEGEPARSLTYRRIKRPALTDVAGMVRSFHYAGQLAAAQVAEQLGTGGGPDGLQGAVTLWYQAVAVVFLRAYLEVAGPARVVPPPEQLPLLLDFLLLDKAIYELGYEANSRPEWTWVPAAGVLELLADQP
ncbi:maltose alpha-D-glucosyltransferase [Aciditerrimonas ferrireducens]|uniref:Maltokinase n=1 Tax=Aciditerrimonas ferrireducens TaxID=667306 RepID=A0ABV6C4Z7_9ACTN